MNHNDILIDAFGRIRELVHRVVTGMNADELTYRPDPDANSVAWLVWHLTRVMDDHISELAGTDQDWVAGGWSERFALPFDPTETGYGHSSEKVGQVRAPADLLLGYHDAVHESSLAYLRRVTDGDLDAIIDHGWDPPVSAGVRLVSVIGDGMQHVGQAAYVQGMARRH